MMNSSKDLYQQFVAFEEQAAAIYLTMASRFSPENPELAAFWLDMGMQEKQHEAFSNSASLKSSSRRIFLQKGRSRRQTRCLTISGGAPLNLM
jgi:rubrerythrin